MMQLEPCRISFEAYCEREVPLGSCAIPLKGRLHVNVVTCLSLKVQVIKW